MGSAGSKSISLGIPVAYPGFLFPDISSGRFSLRRYPVPVTIRKLRIEDAMPAKKPSDAELAWKAAETALEAARQLPVGVERFEALKRAGKLRFDADIKRAREIGPLGVCPND